MEEKFEIGSFGRARFPQEKKGFKSGIDAYGTIESMDKKYILFKDNDDYVYLVNRKDFQFANQEFKELKKK